MCLYIGACGTAVNCEDVLFLEWHWSCFLGSFRYVRVLSTNLTGVTPTPSKTSSYAHRDGEGLDLMVIKIIMTSFPHAMS